MVVGTITPPLLLAASLSFSASDTAYFISVALLASGLGAFLASAVVVARSARLAECHGHELRVHVAAHAGVARGGLAMMFGLSFVAAPVQMLLAPFLSRLRAVFTAARLRRVYC